MTENSKKLVEIIWKYLEPFDLNDEEKNFVNDVEKRADSNQLGNIINKLVYIIESYIDIKDLKSNDYEIFSDARELGIVKNLETDHIKRLSIIIADQEEDIRKKRESNKRLEERGTVDMIELEKRQKEIDRHLATTEDIKSMNKKSLKELEEAHGEIHDLKIQLESLPEECEHYDHCSELAIATREPRGC